MSAELAGAWRLVSYRFTDDDGRETYPWSRDAVGMIVFSADGQMSAQIMEPGREPLPADASDAEVAAAGLAAYRGFLAYFGEFTLDEAAGTLTTVVTGALNPSMVGTSQQRHYTLEGDRLTLQTTGLANGSVGELVWERTTAD